MADQVTSERGKAAGGGVSRLEVYQRAHEMGVRIHRFSLKLPKYEFYEIGSQLRRASKSVSANIVEGYGRRRYKADFIRFLTYAYSSCSETIEWMTYLKHCHVEFEKECGSILELLDSLGRKLNRFIRTVEKQHNAEII